jgi:hypothetical protein
MIIVKASKDSEAGIMPEEQMFHAMAEYHEELAKAGILVDASGLQPTSKGFRIEYGANGSRTVIDGPFAESKELIAGYTIIRVNSREEALDWAKRYPNPVGQGREAQIEVRQFFEMEDFAPSEGVDRFKDLIAEREAKS